MLPVFGVSRSVILVIPAVRTIAVRVFTVDALSVALRVRILYNAGATRRFYPFFIQS